MTPWLHYTFRPRVLWIAPAEFLADLGVGVLPEACEVPCLLYRAEVRCENVVTHFELAVGDFMLAAELHEVFYACRNLNENAVCTLYNLAAALFIGCGDRLVTIAGSLAVWIITTSIIEWRFATAT